VALFFGEKYASSIRDKGNPIEGGKKKPKKFTSRERAFKSTGILTGWPVLITSLFGGAEKERLSRTGKGEFVHEKKTYLCLCGGESEGKRLAGPLALILRIGKEERVTDRKIREERKVGGLGDEEGALVRASKKVRVTMRGPKKKKKEIH